MTFLRSLFGRRVDAPPPAKAAPTAPLAEPAPAPAEPPRPAVRARTISRPNRSSDRVKSRLMNYGQLDAVLDEMELENGNINRPIARPVGWLVVIEGPGTGAWFTLESGLARIGRDKGQTICLDFGDTAVSRATHVSIAYEPADHRFRLGLGQSKNAVLVNGTTIHDTIDLQHGDLITVGETTLRFAAFCDDRFAWAPIIDKGKTNALSA